MRCLPIDDLHPTQLYLSSEKLAAVVDWFDFEEPNYGTLPAFRHDGDWYLADGHTRAFVSYLAGVEEFRVERDEEIREEYDFDLYRTCIAWCADAGVETVPDLRGRIVNPDTYEERWLDRCRRTADESES
ncbi:MAG: histone acetyltransferase [Halobacteriales archaeon]